jgi:hypothetical protein
MKPRQPVQLVVRWFSSLMVVTKKHAANQPRRLIQGANSGSKDNIQTCPFSGRWEGSRNFVNCPFMRTGQFSFTKESKK